MSFITINKKLHSTTLSLPQLKPWLGKKVEIIVRPETETSTKESSLDNFFSACNNVKIDQQAVQRLRQDSIL